MIKEAARKAIDILLRPIHIGIGLVASHVFRDSDTRCRYCGDTYEEVVRKYKAQVLLNKTF